MKQTKNQKAIDAYKARLAEVQQQIARIQGALVTDVDDGMWLDEKLHWGHVGDLQCLANDLRSAANLLTGDQN